MGCPNRIVMTEIMCTRHWCMVPEETRAAIWHTYRNGPSWAYRNNVTEAIRLLASA